MFTPNNVIALVGGSSQWISYIETIGPPYRTKEMSGHTLGEWYIKKRLV